MPTRLFAHGDGDSDRTINLLVLFSSSSPVENYFQSFLTTEIPGGKTSENWFNVTKVSQSI